MQAQPQCYIDTDGRVACDAGGPMHNPNNSTAAAQGAAAQSQYITARPTQAPECCVHILTSDVGSISPENPGRGRIDCPERPEIHESDVAVVQVQPDGQGGMVATVEPVTNGGRPVPAHGVVRAVNATAPMRLPVCTVGPQDKEPVPCCLVAAADGSAAVKCDDTSHPAHGLSGEEALAAGYTLELCPPPIEVPPCCVEIGDFEGKNARLVCEDESHSAHLRPIDVQVSPDGMSAAIKVGDNLIEIPVCITETQPEEIPCCVRDGLLVCPGTPWHGMSYEDVMARHDVSLLPCEDVPPPVEIPQDCCVRIDNGRAFLVCSGNSPWNGYELKPNQYQCHDVNGGQVCEVALQAPGRSDLVTVTFPVCDEGIEPVPPDCCYDVATGTLVCIDTASQWHGLKVNLINLSESRALVAHPMLGSRQVMFPICVVPTPEDCCFEPSNSAQEGALGRILCKSDSGLNGMEAIIANLNQMPDGSLIATVSFPGGSSRMPLCKPPPEECPECPPPYFCCVNLDTKLFVCPANPARHGRPAPIQSVEEINGVPWVVLADGQRIPACGLQCPAPEPCKPPGLVPTPPGACPPTTRVPSEVPPGPRPAPSAPPGCPPGASETLLPGPAPGGPRPAPATGTPCPQTGTDIPTRESPGPRPAPPVPACPDGSPIPGGTPPGPRPAPGIGDECPGAPGVPMRSVPGPRPAPSTPACPPHPLVPGAATSTFEAEVQADLAYFGLTSPPPDTPVCNCPDGETCAQVCGPFGHLCKWKCSGGDEGWTWKRLRR